MNYIGKQQRSLMLSFGFEKIQCKGNKSTCKSASINPRRFSLRFLGDSCAPQRACGANLAPQTACGDREALQEGGRKGIRKEG